jgi:hypothetical protein
LAVRIKSVFATFAAKGQPDRGRMLAEICL